MKEGWIPLKDAKDVPVKVKRHSEQTTFCKNGDAVEFKLKDDMNARVRWCPWPQSVERPKFSVKGAQYHPVRSFTGGLINQPRKTRCYDHSYQYSGQTHPVEPDTPESITGLYHFIHSLFGVTVNMCLANAYFHGHHSISAHSDDESQMGELHDVYCFVTGATRRAIFRTKKTKDTPVEVVLDLELPEGLYVMMGSDFQKHFTHEFPKIHETAFKSFCEKIPTDVKLETTMDKADWIWEHREEIRESVRGTKYFDAFEKWIQPRFSFTLRQFKENPRKRLKFDD